MSYRTLAGGGCRLEQDGLSSTVSFPLSAALAEPLLSTSEFTNPTRTHSTWKARREAHFSRGAEGPSENIPGLYCSHLIVCKVNDPLKKEAEVKFVPSCIAR